MASSTLVLCTAPVEQVERAVRDLLPDHAEKDLVYVGSSMSPFRQKPGFVSWGRGMFTWKAALKIGVILKNRRPGRVILPLSNNDGAGFFALRAFSRLITRGPVTEVPPSSPPRELTMRRILRPFDLEEGYHACVIMAFDLLYPLFYLWLRPRFAAPRSAPQKGSIDYTTLRERPVEETPEVSVVIRTCNEERFLRQTLEAVMNQEGPTREVIVIDSQSTDATVAIARSFAVRIFEIDGKSFNYSAALNLGARLARGKYIVNLSAHALPANDQWLKNLVAPLGQPEVAGVYGRERPLENWSSPFEKKNLGDMFKDRMIVHTDKFFFSNASSAIPRALLMDFPFDESVVWGEDQLWVRHMQKKGYKTVYQPAAAVYHSHNLTLRETFVRCQKFHEMLFGHLLTNRVDEIRAYFRNVLPQRAVSFRRFLAERRLVHPLFAFFYAPFYEYVNYLGCEISWRKISKASSKKNIRVQETGAHQPQSQILSP